MSLLQRFFRWVRDKVGAPHETHPWKCSYTHHQKHAELHQRQLIEYNTTLQEEIEALRELEAENKAKLYKESSMFWSVQDGSPRLKRVK
jgi:hypothetical protein